MKLIFLFVDKFKLFSQKEFNLDSEYSVHYETMSHKLEIGKQQAFKSDFWHVGASPTDSHTVESISAIVGENGSGKTTFAQILLELFRVSKTKDFKCIAVFKIGDKIMVYHSPDLPVSGEGFVSKSTDRFPIDSCVKFCYYSPVYTTERDRGLDIWDDGDTCYDLSTTGLLKSYTRDVNTRDQDIFTAFDIDEKRRVLEFISHVEDVCQQSRGYEIQFPIRYPVAVWLEIEELAVQRARDAIERKKEMFHKADEEPAEDVTSAEQRSLTVLDRLLSVSKKVPNADFFIRAFWWYAILHLYDLNSTQFSVLGPAEEIGLLVFLESIADSQEKPIEMHKRIFAYLEESPPKRKSNGQIVNDQTEKVVLQTFLCLEELLKMPGIKESNGMIVLPLDKPDIRQKLLNLVVLHGKSSIFAKFLRFSFPHSISSGEMAFLSMFSRLYECFSNFVTSSNAKDDKSRALVLLDEAETALHPSFQQKLVYNAIWFFETFFPRVKVHLIFASHSPILLSDIPKSNCVFLIRESDNEKAHIEENELRRLNNTFGANIFDLYKLSFFMENGTIGQFASEKIDSVLRKLNEAIPSLLSQQESSVKLLTQKDLAQINDVKSLIGDPTLLTYINVALRAINLKKSSGI